MIKNLFKEIVFHAIGADKIIAEREASYEKACADLVAAEGREREISKQLSESRANVFRAYDLQREAKKIIDMGAGDPAPTDEKEYERYVARLSDVAELLRPKLMQLIAIIREELDWSGLADEGHPSDFLVGVDREQYDHMLRGTSNAFRLVLDWLDQVEGANAAIINRDKPTNA